MRFVCPKILNARAVLETSVTEILLEISKRVLFYDKLMSLKVGDGLNNDSLSV